MSNTAASRAVEQRWARLPAGIRPTRPSPASPIPTVSIPAPSVDAVHPSVRRPSARPPSRGGHAPSRRRPLPRRREECASHDLAHADLVVLTTITMHPHGARQRSTRHPHFENRLPASGTSRSYGYGLQLRARQRDDTDRTVRQRRGLPRRNGATGVAGHPKPGGTSWSAHHHRDTSRHGHGAGRIDREQSLQRPPLMI